MWPAWESNHVRALPRGAQIGQSSTGARTCTMQPTIVFADKRHYVNLAFQFDQLNQAVVLGVFPAQQRIANRLLSPPRPDCERSEPEKYWPAPTRRAGYDD